MPWSRQCLESSFAKFDQVAFVDERSHFRLLPGHLYLKYIGETNGCPQYLDLIRVDLQTYVIGISYERIARYVVYMAMGVDEARRLQAQVGDCLDQLGALSGIAAARIDHCAFLCFVVY